MEQLEIYFRQYMLKVRKLSLSSVNHYTQALRTISRYLRDAGLLTGDIYSVEQLSQLESLRNALKRIHSFVELDETGNRMYTAGLNRYIEFAEFHLFKGIDSRLFDISQMDIAVEKPRQLPKVTYGWNRDRVIVEQVLATDNYRCEINPLHETFVSRFNDKLYLEGHHLIPMSKQTYFAKSLDVYANIIGLCPNCHRQLHFGRIADVKVILTGLYDSRVERLARSGIAISKEDFINLALE